MWWFGLGVERRLQNTIHQYMCVYLSDRQWCDFSPASHLPLCDDVRCDVTSLNVMNLNVSVLLCSTGFRCQTQSKHFHLFILSGVLCLKLCFEQQRCTSSVKYLSKHWKTKQCSTCKVLSRKTQKKIYLPYWQQVICVYRPLFCYIVTRFVGGA